MVAIKISLTLFSQSLLSACYASGTLGVIQQVSDGITILNIGKSAIESSTKETRDNWFFILLYKFSIKVNVFSILVIVGANYVEPF